MSQLRIQNARVVAYRALSLGALLKRGELELAVQENYQWSRQNRRRKQGTPEQEALDNQLHEWLLNENIVDYLSDMEYQLLSKPLGTWSERTLTTVSWRTEALGTMLWTLNRIDKLPDYDTQFDISDILEPLDIFTPTIDFIWMASLRSDDELTQARDQAEMWNWRSRARELQRMGVKPPEGVSFQEIIRLTTERAYNDKLIAQTIKGDFPAYGKSYTELNPDEYALVSSIAYERNSALSWICEITSEWESIRIDQGGYR